MLKLYHSPGSCAFASHITLNEAGAEFELALVDFGKSQQREPDYLAINSKGRVPALVTDQGILTESPAILFYLAQTFADAKLAPLDDPYRIAEMQSFNSYLCSTVHVNHAHGGRAERWADEESSRADMKRKMPETVGASMDLVEQQMLKGPWVMGNAYTICDPYLFTIARWLDGDGVPAARHPKVRAHMQRMRERPAVQKSLTEAGLDA